MRVFLRGALIALTFAGCASRAASEQTRCGDVKRALAECLGTGAPDLDCGALAPTDVARIESAMDTFSCSALGQGITIDGDPKSASCRMYGVGCVASRTEAPTRTPTRHPIVLVSGIDDSALFRYSARIVTTMRDGGGHRVFLATLPLGHRSKCVRVRSGSASKKCARKRAPPRST